MADPTELLLETVACKAQSSTLGLKTCRTRALIIYLSLNTIWAVHMSVTSVKNLFVLLKLAPFEMQGTFLFAMRHTLPTKACIFETRFIMRVLWRTS